MNNVIKAASSVTGIFLSNAVLVDARNFKRLSGYAGICFFSL